MYRAIRLVVGCEGFFLRVQYLVGLALSEFVLNAESRCCI